MTSEQFSRQRAVPSIGQAGQQALKDGSVLIVGAGGLGHPVATYLAAAGVGSLTIVDADTVALDNLARQFLFSTDDVGKSKALTIARHLSARHAGISVNGVNERLGEGSKDLVERHDLVVDATDNFAARYTISDLCLSARIPHVWGAVYRYEGFCASFPPDPRRNYRAFMPEAPPEHLAPTCASGGVVGPVCGVVGSMMATEVIKCLTGNPAAANGCVVSVDAEFNRFESGEVIGSTKTLGIKQTPSSLVQEITSVELEKQLAGDTPPVLVDVRGPDEVGATDLLPTAISVPLNELWAWSRRSFAMRNIVFYCASGRRSTQAVDIFLAVHPDACAASLAGGYASWQQG